MRRIRACFDDATVRVYQAYGREIADRAIRAQTFVPPFKMERMTWIKPSFLWMMYRSGWGNKPGQERILAIDISRSGFEWALSHSCLSHFDPTVYDTHDDWLTAKARAPVRIQFDPDRSPAMEALETRAIQIGLSGEAVGRYVHEWITTITDITEFAHELKHLVDAGKPDAYLSFLPIESLYPVSQAIARRIGITAGPD